jgi:hypothetical protein
MKNNRLDILKNNAGSSPIKPGGDSSFGGGSPISRLLKKPGILEEKLAKGASPSTAEDSGGESLLFGDKEEISRKELRRRLKKDADLRKAEKKSGLRMSRSESGKLEKEVFQSVLGRNISEKDLKYSVHKLSKKLRSTTDPAEHAKLRKEIKFFKKIGGL